MTPRELLDFPRCPRPCVECADGSHHFSTAMTDESGERYQCKHCDETAEMCDECGEAVYPNTGQAVCDECTANRGDFE